MSIRAKSTYLFLQVRELVATEKDGHHVFLEVVVDVHGRLVLVLLVRILLPRGDQATKHLTQQVTTLMIVVVLHLQCNNTVESLTKTPLSNDYPATTTVFFLTDVFPYIVVTSVATTPL